MTATLEIGTGEIPNDDPPSLDETGDFNPEYPGSTPEAPYGFKDDGTPYKRRPKGTASRATSTATGTRRMAASESQARAAANMLARMNSILAFSFVAMGFSTSAEQLQANNETFTEMAYEALLTDPALCRKILSAGSDSGKAQLTMAYVMLAGSIVPAAVQDIKIKRLEKEMDNEQAG